MPDANLFGEPVTRSEAGKRHRAAGLAAPKLLRAQRQQVMLLPTNLESLLPEDHIARDMWSLVGELDLSGFLAAIETRENEAGRPAIDPRILVTLWLYATSEGVGSARELARLCTAHDAYRWICGGVPVCPHTLSDFRVGHTDALDDVMTQVLGLLIRHGGVELKRVAQDGTRIRASAGTSSFHRKRSLETCLEEARRHVEEVASTADENISEIQAAARKRAAQDRLERVKRAIEELPKAIAAKKTAEKRENARVSTTDPEVRVMKMANGGFSPAWNVQVCSDTRSRIITGVSVDNRGSDRGDLSPMLQQIEDRTGLKPVAMLADGGYVEHNDIAAIEAKNVTAYIPPTASKSADPHLARSSEPPVIGVWRSRMATKKAKKIYKERAATAESINADLKCLRGLDRFLVRTIPKVTCVVFWSAISYNALKLIAWT